MNKRGLGYLAIIFIVVGFVVLTSLSILFNSDEAQLAPFPISCIESDGGRYDFTTQGVVRGRTSSGQFVYTDNCTSPDMLKEYYCASNLAPLFVNQNCSLLSPGGMVCQNGECVCVENHHQQCYAGELYWFDSCGNPLEIAEDCQHGCRRGGSSCNVPVNLCGNGAINPGEQCDGTNLNGNTCNSLGWEDGTLSCNSNCQLNESLCYQTSQLVDNTPPLIGYEEGFARTGFDIQAQAWEMGSEMQYIRLFGPLPSTQIIVSNNCGNPCTIYRNFNEAGVYGIESASGGGSSVVYVNVSNMTWGQHSCTDTDGSDPFVTGRVFGLNDSGEYNQTDFCNAGNHVGEYVCNGDYRERLIAHDCSDYGQNYYCKEGRCVNAANLPGGTAFRVFVTNASYTGNLGDLAGGDAKCQQQADAAGLGGIWKAWLSNNTISASQRLLNSQEPYNQRAYRRAFDGALIAYSWTDLTDGWLLHGIKYDQYGNQRPYAWTGTNLTGDVSITGGQFRTCNNWLSSTSSFYGQSGQPAFAISLWTMGSGAGSRCDTFVANPQFGLYCIEQP